MMVPENVTEALASTMGLSSWLGNATESERRKVKKYLAGIMEKAKLLNDANRPGF